VIALGSGFVGGEVIPLFVIGATLGSTLAAPLHMSPVLLAACGLATIFTTSAQIGLTGIVIATELFGRNTTIPAAIVAITAWSTIGRQGLYVNRGESAGPPDGAPSTSR
jgi:H+/Cl- antiporter ClcA